MMSVWLMCVVVGFLVDILSGNNVPVIGILSLPCKSPYQQEDCPSWTGINANSYFPASYVKFLEAGGAKVVPLLFTDTESKIRDILSKINGVLFTGGTASFDSTSQYYIQVNNILNYMRQYYASTKQSIPLWATCLGFQALICATSQEGTSILKGGYDAYNVPLNIDFTKYANNSNIFSSFMPNDYSSQVYNILATQNVTLNDHSGGFNPNTFMNDNYLSSNFSILGTSTYNGKTFVTMIESILGLNWYGTQYHPEKPQYEFTNQGIPHNLDSIFVNQYLSEFFVNQCRISNNNTITQNELDSMVIYNYNPYFVDKNDGSSFEQNYLFE